MVTQGKVSFFFKSEVPCILVDKNLIHTRCSWLPYGVEVVKYPPQSIHQKPKGKPAHPLNQHPHREHEPPAISATVQRYMYHSHGQQSAALTQSHHYYRYYNNNNYYYRRR